MESICYVIYIVYSIRGAFHDNFPGFLCFGFRRKIARTKTQQGTDKASKHNGRTLFSRALVFCTHQQKWRQLSFILYPLFILLPHNLCQLPFSPTSEHAAAILYHMSVPPGGALLPPPPPIPVPDTLPLPTVPKWETEDGFVVWGRLLMLRWVWDTVVSF